MYMAVTSRFPNISTVRVRDAIQQIQDMLASLARGVSAASLVTILAGLLVLAGAIAAGTRARPSTAAPADRQLGSADSWTPLLRTHVNAAQAIPALLADAVGPVFTAGEAN